MNELFSEAAKSQGLPFLMACIAIGFIQHMNKGLIRGLNEERSKHLQALADQIGDLKEAILECDRDRKELWLKIAESKTLRVEIEKLKNQIG
jgi:hypothetical protein